MRNYNADFGDMLGKTLKSIEGLVEGSEHVTFAMTDGSEYIWLYEPD